MIHSVILRAGVIPAGWEGCVGLRELVLEKTRRKRAFPGWYCPSETGQNELSVKHSAISVGTPGHDGHLCRAEEGLELWLSHCHLPFPGGEGGERLLCLCSAYSRAAASEQELSGGGH